SAGVEWAADRMELATIETSPSDFVAGRVERRLRDAGQAPAVRWLDPTAPAIPQAPAVAEGELGEVRSVVEAMRDRDGNPLEQRQVDAIVDGLQSRVQLLQGPPGTGKTVTTSIAVLARILLRRSAGDVVLVGANTHAAVDGLLRRIVERREQFAEYAAAAGRPMASVRILRVEPDATGASAADEEIRATSCVRQLQGLATENVLVIGGTTSKLLKLAQTLAHSFPTFSELVVDEASMMVFPHFLALATLLDRDGHAMLAGDHRQLAPILAHDWEREDRPPVELYQPHLSAYDAIARLGEQAGLSPRSLRRSALELSFRLPPRVVELIARVYRQDDIQLRGLDRAPDETPNFGADPWSGMWSGAGGVFLVLHDEQRSRKANALEIELLARICSADGTPAAGEIAVITPHRAQRELLRARLGDRVALVDTVERLQGGERSAIIVSGTASDPAAIAASEQFILDLNRSNVAFSRVKDRLIVVCASSLLDHIPNELEQYDETMLWKALRSTCSNLVADLEVDGHRVLILTPPATLAHDAAAT
ncbi:MAG TPA: AAA domain-containing protein, partial [Solirubrobacteraceae bacterium]